MTTATLERHTCQSITADSKEGKTLLRRIAKNSDGWTGRADHSTNWRLVLTRTIPGEIGEPDRTVSVLTDIDLTPRRNHSTDWDGDTKLEITIPDPRRVWLRYELSTVCHFIADGWSLDAHSTLGSLNTSRLGIGFWKLTARHPSNYGIRVEISETTYQNGRQLTSGAIE